MLICAIEILNNIIIIIMNCDWFIQRSDYKVPDNLIGSRLVENTWSFKPIIFDESVTIMINIQIVHHFLLARTFCLGDGKAFIYRTYHIVSWWLIIFL